MAPRFLGITMKALWLEDRTLRLRDDVPRPRRTRDEALVRVLRAGICNTDLEMVEGYYPFTGILGHEFVGVVEEGPDHLVGQRVVGEINTSCGDCAACRRGLETHCEKRTVLGLKGRDGAFAEYLTLPSHNLHRVPDTIDADVATFTEPLAAALRIQEQVPLTLDDRVLVVGNGKLGQLIAQTLALLPCHLEVAGRRPINTRFLEARGIATRLVGDVPSGTFDVAVECTGNAGGIDLALRALRPRGVLVVKSTFSGRADFDLAGLVVREITLVGSRCGPFPPALDLLATRQIDVERLIEARYPLSGAREAFERAGRPGVLKILLDIAGPE